MKRKHVIGTIVVLATVTFFFSWLNDASDKVLPETGPQCEVTGMQLASPQSQQQINDLIAASRAYRMNGDYQMAICLIESTVMERNGTSQTAIDPLLGRELAEAYISIGMIGRAEEVLLDTVAMMPDHPEVYTIRKANFVLRLAELARTGNDLERELKYLRMARALADEAPEGLIFKERLYQMEIEYFESQGKYSQAAQSAKDLLDSRIMWRDSMRTGADAEDVASIKRMYQRLLELSTIDP